MSTWYIAVDGIHSQFERALGEVVRRDAFLCHDRAEFQTTLLDVVFGAEPLSDWVELKGMSYWIPFIPTPERKGIVQGLLRDVVHAYTRLFTEHLNYTPNFLAYDYVVTELDTVTVTDRVVELTPQHVAPLLTTW